MKTTDIHIRDPYILPLPDEGRYFLFANFAKDGRQRGTQILVADKPEGPYRDFAGRLWLTLHQPNNSPNERPLWLEVVENNTGLTLKHSEFQPEITDDSHSFSTLPAGG